MDPRDGQQPDPKLEAFLDGMLEPSDEQAYARSLQADPTLRATVELQRRIDAVLKHRFPVILPAPSKLEAMLAERLKKDDRAQDKRLREAIQAASRRRQWYWVGIVIAASIAWFAVFWQLSYFRPHEPYFEARPLVQLYAEAVQAGFQPYYECRDENRFADTFLIRQGKPLRLLPLPAGTRMLGLSYVGGLSRQTTAMLCKVGDTPVMVFVDRASRDTATASRNQNPDMHLFRTEKYGLVFYEVSPLQQAQVTEFFAVAD